MENKFFEKVFTEASNTKNLNSILKMKKLKKIKIFLLIPLKNHSMKKIHQLANMKMFIMKFSFGTLQKVIIT